jgi:hypothetical protein
MLKKLSAVLGFGLLCLWMFGLSNPEANSWVNWFVGLLAIVSFSISAFTPDYPVQRVRVGIPMGISAALFSLGVITLFLNVSAWQKIWTLVFGCLYFGLGIVGAVERKEPPMEYPLYDESLTSVKEQEKKRKAA